MWLGEKMVQRPKGATMKKQFSFPFLQFSIAVVITIFIAGIIVPSVLRSDLATRRATSDGNLHTVNVAGTSLSYTNQNIGFAILGAFAGTAAALAIHFRAATPGNTISARITTLRAALLRH
jgi:hypothetical protein